MKTKKRIKKQLGRIDRLISKHNKQYAKLLIMQEDGKLSTEKAGKLRAKITESIDRLQDIGSGLLSIQELNKK